MKFRYDLTPDRKLDTKNELTYNAKPVISIITAYYNGGKTIDKTAISVLNQTYPFFEWLIINDGSTEIESIEKLKEIEKLDPRIRILHKENGGLADTRDYGAKHASETSEFFIFLDDDDLINKTYLECAYITLKTNKDASWAYTDVIGFGAKEYIWVKEFDSEEEKKNNLLVATALIRKEAFFKVNGYELKEKAVHEDWNLWLKMLSKKMFPVRMSMLGFWYRKKEQKDSELYRALQNRKKAMKIVNKVSSKIKYKVEAVQYPKQDYYWDDFCKFNKMLLPQYKPNNKIKVLFVIPWMTIGGADKFNLDLLKGLDKNKFEVIVVSTEPNINPWRLEFEEYAKAIYDLTTFLDRKYWVSFINYIIQKENINIILNSNSTFGYNALPYIKANYPKLPIIDYIHMEEWYNRNGGFSRDSSNIDSVIDKTLVCNEKSRQILINHFKRKENEIETVYIGVDEEKFNSDNFIKEELLKKYKLPKDKKIITFIARIDVQKRPYLLVEIIKKLNKQRKDFIVAVAGDGPLLQDIKNKIKEFGLSKVVVFLGAIADTNEIYAISDVTLNCSIKEGLALTSYESLSSGIPVVSANVGGQAELINTEVGVIVPCLQKENEILNFKYDEKEIKNYVKALNKVLNNLQYYKNNCRKRILDKFTIKQMISKMSSILTNVAKNPDVNKIKRAEELKNNKRLLKELLTKYIMAHSNEYAYLCQKHRDDRIQENHSQNECTKIENKTVQVKGKINFSRLAVKLHIYNETSIIVDICRTLYWIFKTIFITMFYGIKTIIISIINFIKLFFIRIINLILKIFGKEGLSFNKYK